MLEHNRNSEQFILLRPSYILCKHKTKVPIFPPKPPSRFSDTQENTDASYLSPFLADYLAFLGQINLSWVAIADETEASPQVIWSAVIQVSLHLKQFARKFHDIRTWQVNQETPTIG